MSELIALSLEEAAQAAIEHDVPLALVPELLAALQGDGMRSVMEARVAQIARGGHTIENDDMLPVGWLLRSARRQIDDARACQIANPSYLPSVRARLVEAVALGLAAIDRIDRELACGDAAEAS